MHSSLDFAVILFEKAKELGIMEKGYVWIVSDEIAGILDSIQSPVILNMQGVIGFKNNYEDTSESFRVQNQAYADENDADHLLISPDSWDHYLSVLGPHYPLLEVGDDPGICCETGAAFINCYHLLPPEMANNGGDALGLHVDVDGINVLLVDKFKGCN
ncbi:unnamed protein product [Fraxinus pennsylvanica]|uniref:Receptor ligand binding region domain-containing protein n=1 Tax=Fraxinus pennsylvanica TaxID=56036 RepID=A0AAD2DKF8_9LAMI|nr:unnamed protein product [Fraxinus pennsylvanica]